MAEDKSNAAVRGRQASRAHVRIAAAFYVLAAVGLTGFAITMILLAIWRVIVSSEEELISRLLESVGLMVVGIAVFDVAKYLIEEEVMRQQELRAPDEARRTITKFLTIIMIAASLEALVLIFEAGHRDLSEVVYPALLLLAIAAILIGLGAFHRLAESGGARRLSRATTEEEPAPQKPRRRTGTA